MIAALAPGAAFAASVIPVPPLPAPSGTVVNVSTESQLQAAVSRLASNTTIVLAPGTYQLTSTLWISGTFSNVGIRGATTNRDDVVLVGPGMTNANYGNVPFGIWTGGNVQGVTIANLTVRNVYQHPIIFNAGTQSPRVYNVHLIDAGQQFLKSNPDSSGVGASNGDVEYSIFEYTTTAPSGYTNAVDIHGGTNWMVRHNLFRNIVGPSGQLAGPAILAWNHTTGTVSEANTFLNCARGIAYGLLDASGNDHSGGIIRNNFFYRSSAQPGDVAIQVADSPNTQVLNNTVLMSGTYPYPIEYRFAGTTGVLIENNLLDGAPLARDGATGTVLNNVTSATSAMFVNAAAGDLHLMATATAAIDRGLTVAGVTTDWDDESRPNGTAPDIGADEFGGTVPAPTYLISGSVSTSSGAAQSGVTVALNGNSSATQTTDAAGAYSFAGLAAGGTYIVTPSMNGLTFAPASRTYSALAANQSGANFTSAAITPPTVSLTSPAQGATFIAPATITVAASAASTGSSIVKVDFYAGATLIGTVATSPYSVSWTVQSAGSYSLTAVATDARGASTRSAALTITVATPPPAQVVTVSMTSPANGSSAIAPATVTLAASAAASSGTVSKVEFFNGSTLIAAATAAPFAATWSNVAAGSYALSAKATGSTGVTATSATVSVTVTASNTGPCPCSVWSASAVPSKMENDGNAVELGVKFRTDVAGSIAGVRFYKYAQNTGTHTGSLWSSSGTRLATVTFTPETGSGWQQMMFSAPVAVSANTTYIVSYHTNTGFYAANSPGFTTAVDNGPLHALASAAAGGNGVYLYGANGGFPNQSYNASNYWVDVVFTTGAALPPPPPAPVVTVSMSSPATGASYTAPAGIALAATATTTSGSISKVEFFNGSTLIATATAAPFAATWSNVAAGSYALSARATGSTGVTKTSTTVNVTVAAPQTVTVSMTSPVNGSTATASASITLAASASASSGTISRVEFFNGPTLIATATAAPFAATWSNVAAGSYALSAKATGSTGVTATSATVAVTVTTAPLPQTVTILLTSPVSGGSYSAPATITLASIASASSGSISKVEYFNGSTLIGTATTAPFGGSWSNVSAGSYALSAKATGSTGVTATSATANVTVSAAAPPPPLPSGSLLQQSNLVALGSFKLPSGKLGSTWGFGSSAGCCGLGTYGVTFNPNRNSIYVGGHPYEQRLAEIAVPSSLSGSPVATALSNLIDPLEGKIGSINPGDSNTKIVGGTLVYNGQLIVSAYSYYDGAGTQSKSTFTRPMELTSTGQVVGPIKIGSLYPGWVDKFASLIPAEWQAAFGGPAFAGGAGGAINALQSWGPSVSVFDPASVLSGNGVPATVVLGYPIAHPLADPNAANTLWSQSDVVTGVVFVPGTRSVLFFGLHGQGAYCYGPGTSSQSQAGQPADGGVDHYCYDPQNGSKGVHNYPYVSYVWAYDANDLASVKAGTKNSYDVKPYATWTLDSSFAEIQGAAYDPATNRLFVSQVGGDPANSGQPLIRVYHVQ